MDSRFIEYRIEDFQSELQTLYDFLNKELALPPIPEIKKMIEKLITNLKLLPEQTFSIEKIPVLDSNYNSHQLIEIKKRIAEYELIVQKITEPEVKPEIKPAEKKSDQRLIRQALQLLNQRLEQIERRYTGEDSKTDDKGIHWPKRYVHKSEIKKLKTEFGKIELENTHEYLKIIQLKINHLFTLFNEQVEKHDKKFIEYNQSLIHLNFFADKPLEKFSDHLNAYHHHDYSRMLAVVINEMTTKFQSILKLDDKQIKLLEMIKLIEDIYHFDKPTYPQQRRHSVG